MLRSTLLSLTLLSMASAGQTAPGFLLGLDYSEWGPNSGLAAGQIAMDGAGALYVLSACTTSSDNSPSCVTKLSSDGNTILWQYNLGLFASTMAVDPEGGVYIVPQPTFGVQQVSLSVEKLTADGTGVQWQTQLGTYAVQFGYSAFVTVDSSGRAFVAAGVGTLSGGSTAGIYLIRLSPAGAVDSTSILAVTGWPTAVAVDPAGADVVVAYEVFPGVSFARLIPNSGTWAGVNLPHAIQNPALAVAPNGDAVVYAGDLNANSFLQRIDPAGNVVFSEAIAATNGAAPGELALDAAGNAYITGSSANPIYPVKNSLAPCGLSWMSVFAPDGSILQTTYLPFNAGPPLIAESPNSSVFLLGGVDASFAPAEAGPFPEFINGTYEPSAVFHLSPNAHARTFPLACVSNAATFAAGPVAPGEIVTLFGNGLGPQQGVQLSATLQSPFPTQAESVQVTFDGKPAPLLWVQDTQINLVVPWSVAGPTTEVCATYNNVQTNCLTWPVAEASPAVFTVDGYYAAALNQDGTLNSATSPAPAHSIVSIFATGLGPIGPPQADGSLVGLPLPVNTLPVQVATYFCPSILGSWPPNCELTLTVSNAIYAGPAPFLIAGASQINFNSDDIAPGGGYLAVETPSGTVSSIYFGIHLAPQ
jgi:uncharacterized protein (TIGR03437 family)